MRSALAILRVIAGAMFLVLMGSLGYAAYIIARCLLLALDSAAGPRL